MSFTADIDEIVARNANGLLGISPSWERIRLHEVAAILNGYPFESSRFSKSEGTPLLRIRDILAGQTETFYKGDFDQEYLVQPGQLVVGMDGDFNCTIWDGAPALLNQRVCKLSVDDQRYSLRFLRYVLPGYLSAINANTSSITVKHLSSRTIASIPLPLPQLAEQRRIVAEIEKQFTRLDAGVAALRRVQAQLKRYRAAVLKAACEGSLSVCTDGHHPSIVKWRTVPLAEVLISLKNGIYKPRSAYAEHGVACLRMYNIENGRIVWKNVKRMTLTEEETEQYRLLPGDVLVNRVNSRELVGKAAPIPPGLEPCVFESKNIRLVSRICGAAAVRGGLQGYDRERLPAP